MKPPTDCVRGLCATLPARVKAALTREAERQGVSLNDLAGRLLGERFGVEFTESGRRPPNNASPHNLVMVFRLPEGLMEEIRAYAFEQRTNMGFEISVALAEALDVPVKIRPPQRTLPLGGGPRLIA
jgi:hypothetical protein